MNLLVKVMHIFRLIQVCQQTVPILHRQIFRQASWLFFNSGVMRHRGISLKIIGVKRFMTWLPATRYFFLKHSVRCRKMLPGYRRKGSFRSGTARLGEGYGSRKLFRIREAEETKNNLMPGQPVSILRRFRMLQIWKLQRRDLHCGTWKKYRVLLNRVDTSTSQDIEWPVLP